MGIRFFHYRVFLFLFIAGTAVTALQAQEYLAPSSPQYMISQEWTDILDAYESRDLQRIHESVQELRELAIIDGVWSYDDYSKKLLAFAEDAYQSGDMEKASFFTRKAIELSPLSVPVRFAALGHLHKLGISSFWSELYFICSHLLDFPFTSLSLLSDIIYPAVLALTFATLVTLLFFITANIVPYLRFLASHLPHALRGVLAPVVGLALLVAPLYFGPLWALVCWSFLAWLSIEKSRKIVIAAGVCVALWGFLLPVRENVQVWLSDPGVKVMLKVQRGDYVPDALKVLQHLSLRRGSDPVVQYVLAIAEKRAGKYEDALKRFEKLDLEGFESSRIAAQMAIIAFLNKDYKQSLQKYEEARDLGLESPALLFNYSKAAFEILDTELSRKLSTEARAKDPALVEELTSREDKIGISAPGTLAEITLPDSAFFDSALLPLPAGASRVSGIAEAILPGIPAPYIGMLGIALFVLGLIGRTVKRSRFESHYYENYRTPLLLTLFMTAIPAGAWIQSGKYPFAIVLLSITFLLLFSLIGWPYDFASLFIIAPWLHTLLIYLTLIYVLIVYYAGFFIEEDE